MKDVEPEGGPAALKPTAVERSQPAGGTLRPAVRWSLLLWAAGLAALAAGYYSGRVVRMLAAAGPQRSGQSTAVNHAAPRSVACTPDPDVPLPKTAEEVTQETKRAIDQLVQTFPGEPDALEMKARLQVWLGNSHDAVQTWEHVLRVNPDYAHAYVGMASTAAEKGEHEKAIRLADKAIHLEPDNFQARAIQADALIQLGRPGEAIPVLEEFVKKDPRSQGFFLLGQACFQLQQYDKAKDNYETAIAKYPDYVHAYHGLSQTYDRLGQRDKAQQARDKFRELESPQQAAKRVRDVQVSDLQVTCDEAAVLLTDAGRVYFVRAKNDDAEALWIRAAAFRPQNVECRQSLAYLCRAAGRLGETISWLSELAGIEPKNPVYLVEIGRICEDLSGPAAAEAAFRRACEAAPERDDGYAALADLLLRYEHQLPETVSLARSAVKFSPTATNYAMLSAACRANGQIDEALTTIEHALRLAPQSASYRAVRDAILAEKKHK